MLEEVFFCENNVSKGYEKIIKDLQEVFPDVTFNIESCLGNCSLCATELYAVINAKIIRATTPEELYKKIEINLKTLLEIV